jgi:hypothetical protein
LGDSLREKRHGDSDNFLKALNINKNSLRKQTWDFPSGRTYAIFERYVNQFKMPSFSIQ